VVQVFCISSSAFISGKNFQDGRQSSYERLVDFLPRMLSYQNQELSDNGTLHPGDRWEERLDLPSRGGANNVAISVSVKLDVAAYSDHTADVGNEPALLRLAGVRHNRALADQKAAEIISAAAAHDVTTDPTGMAVTQLRTELEQARRKKGEHELEVELMAIIANLENRKSDLAGRICGYMHEERMPKWKYCHRMSYLGGRNSHAFNFNFDSIMCSCGNLRSNNAARQALH
jgi:hypothetical protein